MKAIIWINDSCLPYFYSNMQYQFQPYAY